MDEAALPFADRDDAGRRLARALSHHAGTGAVVKALPRGGVPVGFRVAEALDAALDVVLVRKIGVPFQPELAAGAVVDGGEPQTVWNEDVLRAIRMTPDDLEPARRRELDEIGRRRSAWRGDRAPVAVEGRTAIVVDDGIATGATARAALRALVRERAARIALAVPVAPSDTLEALRGEVDELVCLAAPDDFRGVGGAYRDFAQTTDDEVVARLAEATRLGG